VVVVVRGEEGTGEKGKGGEIERGEESREKL
jgi:hypothetical protein